VTDGANVTVRLAGPGDVADILRLIRALATYEFEPDAVEATEESLATSLFAPRRRLWLRLAPDDGRTVVTAAGLARGDDVGLQPELDRVLAETLARTADRPPVAPRDPTAGEATP